MFALEHIYTSRSTPVDQTQLFAIFYLAYKKKTILAVDMLICVANKMIFLKF